MTLQDLERDHQHRVLAIQQRYGVRVHESQKKVDEVETLWEDIRSEVERLPRYSSGWFYWPFMTVLAFLEAPLNRLSFELFFSESPLWSFFVALMCGLLLIALSHFFGLGICRFRYNMTALRRATGKRRSGVSVIGQLLIQGSLILAICYGIAILRQGYLLFALGGDTSFAQALEQQNYSGAAALVLNAGLRVEGLVFLIINLGVVGVGIFAACLCHDPHPDFQEQDQKLKASRKDLAFQKRIFAEIMAKEERRYAAAEMRHHERSAMGRALPNFSQSD